MSGRKRHILVDTLSLRLRVLVHAADIADREGGQELLAPLKDSSPRLAKLWADAGYQGGFTEWVQATLGWAPEIVRKPRRWLRCPADQDPPALPTGFQVLPAPEEAWIYLAMIRLMVVRLAA